ncbi:hypothetical protein Q3G72_005562 [Acer saccharum]|nr:hypothetical protein Q3G72_005562 [Acer saccharum]
MLQQLRQTLYPNRPSSLPSSPSNDEISLLAGFDNKDEDIGESGKELEILEPNGSGSGRESEDDFVKKMEEVRKIPERDGAGIVSVKEVIATDEKRSDLECQLSQKEINLEKLQRIAYSGLPNGGVSEAKTSVDAPIVNGLSWTFYKKSCPKAESIIRTQLKKVFKKDIGQAAGLLRLHFHDCFVQGCDGSVLLDGSASGPGEQEATPNLTLRKEAFDIIDDLRERVHKACGRVVSCSDIVAIAARDSVTLSGGPDYELPLGRRDGLTFATAQATVDNLVPPTADTTFLLNRLATKNLDKTDAVALSGGHTIGISHCSSFTDRLYPTQDPTMDETFANNLKKTCPAVDTPNTVFQDIRTPNVFDNKYYVDLMNRQGLFTSDQDLYTDKRTRDIVTSFAVDEKLFFDQFALSMIKMGQMSVLTGIQGEVRANCSIRNPDNKSYLASVVDDEVTEEGWSAEL